MDKEYDEFMTQYNKDHAACPVCGQLGFTMTFVAYMLDLDNKEKYVDRNRCTCSSCGDTHITYDRVPATNTYKKVTKITSCYNSCPLFKTDSDGMYCGHPVFEKSDNPYESMIITQYNSKEQVPKECPLLKEQLILTYTL